MSRSNSSAEPGVVGLDDSLQDWETEPHQQRRRQDQDGGQGEIQEEKVPWELTPSQSGHPLTDAEWVVAAEVLPQPINLVDPAQHEHQQRAGPASCQGLDCEKGRHRITQPRGNEAAEIRSGAKAREIDGQQRSEGEGGRFHHHPQQAEPDDFQGQGHEAGQRINRRPARERQRNSGDGWRLGRVVNGPRLSSVLRSRQPPGEGQDDNRAPQVENGSHPKAASQAHLRQDPPCGQKGAGRRTQRVARVQHTDRPGSPIDSRNDRPSQKR